jgi:hypothetical protein
MDPSGESYKRQVPKQTKVKMKVEKEESMTPFSSSGKKGKQVKAPNSEMDSETDSAFQI